MKACFKCGQTKERSEFYVHKRMGDGLLGKCKECTKADVRQHRVDNPGKHSEYERKRFATTKRRAQLAITKKRMMAKYPEKYLARQRTARAIASGMLVPQPCQECGMVEVQAHHPDYSKPLDVMWLCHFHHRKIHNGHAVIMKPKNTILAQNRTEKETA